MCVLIKNDWNAWRNASKRAEFLLARRETKTRNVTLYVSSGNERRKAPEERTTLLPGANHNFRCQRGIRSVGERQGYGGLIIFLSWSLGSRSRRRHINLLLCTLRFSLVQPEWEKGVPRNCKVRKKIRMTDGCSTCISKLYSLYWLFVEKAVSSGAIYYYF